ncbi:MAG TPA: hypothetical protein DD490_14985 [Acidobacteria bacterium]|nr:hypothetical protein [Acidobacteriota bacterium]
MKTIRLTCLLSLLVATSIAPAAAAAAGSGVIPLQLTDAEPSYLGVALVDACDPCRPTRDARLPVTNDGSNVAGWGASVPLGVLETRVLGTETQIRVMPLGFNLADPLDGSNTESFTYTVTLAPGIAQPQSVLTLAKNTGGSPTTFTGTLYIAATLYMTDKTTGAPSEQRVLLALSLDGKWTEEPAVSQLDGGLSPFLLFTEREEVSELPKDDYTCLLDMHPDGYFCLQASPSLLEALSGR